jgi:hypothetical protein
MALVYPDNRMMGTFHKKDDYMMMMHEVDYEEQRQTATCSVDWRQGPTVEGMASADWTIEVGCLHGPEYHSYPVHESIIAKGPIYCGYFSRFFQSNDMLKASGTSIIPIELGRRAAELFPSFLDFLYCSPRFHITSETAVGLRYLAEFFNVPHMQEATWTFIKKDMSLHNLERYLRDANEFADTQTANWVSFECAKHLAHLDPSAPVLRALTPCNFKQVIYLARLSHKGNSIHWSEIVAVYCSARAKELDAIWFKDLTSSQNLPVISHKAALQLLETEFIVRSLSTVVDPTSTERLTSLQRRCVKALAADSDLKKLPKQF